MLRNVRKLQGFDVRATDGDIGHVDEFYFDDTRWTIRYLVVDTGGWLSGRKVLVSPYALGAADWRAERLHVNLTRQMIENSPDIDPERPVSRQQEIQYSGHYGWPYWWAGPGLWGPMAYPGLVPPAPELLTDERDERAALTTVEEEGDPHLRSTKEVMGYVIHALDGEIGHVGDFIVDDRSWEIRYLVVDTGGWWPGKKVLVPPEWIERVSWPDAAVEIDLHRETIKNGPEWDPDTPISRDFEDRLFGYYGRPRYWQREEAAVSR
jgi:hypothetical protein